MKTPEQVHAAKRQATPRAEAVAKVLTWGVGGTLMLGAAAAGVLNGAVDQARPEWRIASAIEDELTGHEGVLNASVYDVGFVALKDSVERIAHTDDYLVTVRSSSNPPEFMNLPPQQPDLQLKAEVTGTWDTDDMFIPIPGLAGEVTLSPVTDEAEQILSAYSQNS